MKRLYLTIFITVTITLFFSVLLISLGGYLKPAVSDYEFPLEFVKNVTHGDRFDFYPNQIITAHQINCRNYLDNGDIIEINMCEECWEGIDCYQKTFDVTWDSRAGMYEELGWTKNETKFCNEVLGAGFFIITYQEFIEYKETTGIKNSEIAYQSLFDDKCDKENLKHWNIRRELE